MAENRQTRTQRNQARQQQNKKQKKPKKWFKRIFLTIIALFLLLMIGGLSLFAYYVSDAPKLDEDSLRAPVSAEFYDKDRNLFAKTGSEETRKYVKYEDIPQQMVDAITATEDARFFEHHGIDFQRLGSAVVANVTNGFGSQGASTITQQVIKNYMLSNEKKLKRKAQEAWLAIQLERNYDKEEIFEMYFNKVLMSGRIYGFGTAAEHFFGKELDELELDEIALLAGMPQSPNNFNPFKHPENAQKRRDTVLDLMVRHKKITKAEADKAKAIDVSSRVLPEDKRQGSNTTKYDAFLDIVLEEINKIGESDSLTDGIKVYTTLDPDAQEVVEDIMNNDANFPTKKIQAGVAVVDTNNGAIRAIGGGRNYGQDRPFNYADDLKDRHPGSTLKPIMDYGPAFEYLKWSTGKKIVDDRITYSNSSKVITNWDSRYLGSLTVREALYASRNVPAVKTFREVGADRVKQFISKLGIKADNLVESDAIGGGTVTLNPIQLAASYAAFGNNGVYNDPYTIREIEYRDGTKKSFEPEPVVAMSDYTAYMVTDVLRDVLSSKPNASGTKARVPGLDVAGKTGTTNYSAEEFSKYNLPSSSVPDSWFVGYTTNYSIAIWGGYSKRSNPITTWDERWMPQRLFSKIMGRISQGKTTQRFVKPSSVVEATIEVGTDPIKLASQFTPSNMRRTELFVKGTVPTSVSTKYKLALNDPTNVKATYNEATKAVDLSWNFAKPENSGNVKITFEVTMSVDGKSSVVGNTGGNSISVGNIEPGKNYTFSVVAVANGVKSKPGSVSIFIDKPVEEPEVTDPTVETPTDGKPTDGTTTDGTPTDGTPTDGKNPNQQPGTTEPNQTPDSNNPNNNGGNSGTQTPTTPTTPTTPSTSTVPPTNENKPAQ